MSAGAVAADTSLPRRRTHALTWAAYALLGVALVASRTVGMGYSLWTDEITALEEFILGGPSEILAGPDLSHELFGLLAWITTSAVGESEVALRVWSVVPFFAGVGLVTAWLHTRVNPLSGVLFLFLATVSPLLLDISRQARGYGLAFLAMAALLVAALEAVRGGRTAAVVALCVAGFVGAATLPQVGIAFVATALVLLTERHLRRRVAVGSVVTAAALLVWYSPHLAEIRSATQIEDGIRIEARWLPTAPVDQILLPALVWIDGTVLVPGLVWLPLVALAVGVAVASPLLRSRGSALVLLASPVATVVVLWAVQAYVIPRYLSFLLVPLFVLVASGAAAVLTRRRSRASVIASAGIAALVVVLALRFATLAPDVVRTPREANRDAADAVLSREPPVLPVLAYARNPQNVEHYLGRPVTLLEGDVAARVCESPEPVVFVHQPFALPVVVVPCLERDGVEHRRFDQYARGGVTHVWFVPPS